MMRRGQMRMWPGKRGRRLTIAKVRGVVWKSWVWIGKREKRRAAVDISDAGGGLVGWLFMGSDEVVMGGCLPDMVALGDTVAMRQPG